MIASLRPRLRQIYGQPWTIMTNPNSPTITSSRYTWIELRALGASRVWSCGIASPFRGPPHVLAIIELEILRRLDHINRNGIGGKGVRYECNTCSEPLDPWEWGTCELCSEAITRRRSAKSEVQSSAPVTVSKTPERAIGTQSTTVSGQLALLGIEPGVSRKKKR
jgi:hypothetical protein